MDNEVKTIFFPNFISGSVLTFSCLEKDTVILAVGSFIAALIVLIVSPVSSFGFIWVLIGAAGIATLITLINYRAKKEKSRKRSAGKHWMLRRGFPILNFIEKKKFAKKGIHPSYFPYGNEIYFRD